jgi:hypothetical protein
MNEIKYNNDLELKIIEDRILKFKNAAAQNLIQLGNELNKAKEKVPHGEWGTWLRKRVQFSQRTANIYMRIAKEFGSNSQAVSNLEITKLGLLLDVPEEKRTSFIEEHNVREMSTRELKAAIRNNTGEYNKSDSVIDYVKDSANIEIDVDCLKALPEHDKYFFKMIGKDWITFLNSVDKHGVYEPIMIARDNTIISGHERVRACKDLGIKKIRAYYAYYSREERADVKDDDELKLKLFILSNYKPRCVDWYIAQFWMDELFNTSYGDCSGDITHYLTNDVIENLNHNRDVMQEMKSIIEKYKNDEITESEMDTEIAILHEQYI